MENLKLTDAEKALIAEIQRDMNNLQQQLQGALRLSLKTRGLEGDNWALDGDALVCTDPKTKEK